MFDFKGTAVFMYNAATIIYYIIFTSDGFGEVQNVMKIVNKNFVKY